MTLRLLSSSSNTRIVCITFARPLTTNSADEEPLQHIKGQHLRVLILAKRAKSLSRLGLTAHYRGGLVRPSGFEPPAFCSGGNPYACAALILGVARCSYLGNE